MATSSVPSVKAAILALLQGQAGFSGVDVRYAPPTKDWPRECVFLGNAEFAEESIPTLRPAPHRHREDYTVPVWVSVALEGNDPQATEERMWTLTGVIEDALRNNLNPSGTALWAIVAGKRPQLGAEDAQWVAENYVSVRVRADI
jgi:hypothetical protein